MREFFVYGFKSRGEVGPKGDRSYDNRRRQLESWLGDYMSFRQSASGRAQLISVDSREVIHNPLYEAFKASTFTNKDILLHFCILDLLTEKEALSISEIADALQADYFDLMDKQIEIDEKTIGNKLKNYAKLGILKQKTGSRNKQYFSLAVNRLNLSSWHDAIEFYSETNPIGIVGSFLLDKKELNQMRSSFWFKHHYMLYAMDSEILEVILEGISENRYIEVVTKTKLEVFPVKLYVSTQNGREYVLCQAKGTPGFTFIRLDNIREAQLKNACKKYQEIQNEYLSCKQYLWGVIIGKASQISHIEMTIRVREDEAFIVQRLEREKRNGRVYKLNKEQYRYVVDTYDAMELMPWIRTFIGRIDKLESSNSRLVKIFNEDMEQLYSMYSGGDEDAI